MALTQISTAGVKDDAVTAGKIPANAVGSSELADNAVDTAAIADDAVNQQKIADECILNSNINTSAAIQGSKLADNSISLAKLTHGDSNNNGKFLRANNGADPSFETVTSTTINNNADNRVITGSGTANTLNGESGVQIDASGNLLVGNSTYNNAAFGGSARGINIAQAQPQIVLHETDTDKDGYLGLANSSFRLTTADSIPITFATADVERMRIDSSGRVGIGVTSFSDTSSALTIKNMHSGSEHTVFEVICDDNETSRISFSEASNLNNGSIRYNFTSDARAMTFHTNGNAERMRIHSNGAISVGTNDSSRSFTLFNPISSDTIFRIQNDVNNEDTGLEIYYTGSSSTRVFRMGGRIQAGNDDMQFAASEAFRFYVDSGSGSNEALRLQTNKRVVTPQVYSTAGSSMRDVQIESDGTLCGLSSITAAKINIADVTDISWLYNLKPKTFNFRKKTTDAKTGVNTYLDEAETEKAYGLLAEDVETVNKDFCFYNKDSEDNDVLAGVYYKTMVVPLIKAVQDLKAENTALTARVAALEAG